jgi:hypothetical protein
VPAVTSGTPLGAASRIHDIARGSLREQVIVEISPVKKLQYDSLGTRIQRRLESFT